MTDLFSFGMGIVVGIVAMFFVLSWAVQPIIRKHEEAERLATTPAPFVPPRPSPAPDAVQDWKQFCKDNGWEDCTEFRGKMAGLYVEVTGEVNILVRPDFVDTRDYIDMRAPTNPRAELAVLFVQAQPGYEEKIIVPKPGTHVQVIRGGWSQKAYFIGIIN